MSATTSGSLDRAEVRARLAERDRKSAEHRLPDPRVGAGIPRVGADAASRTRRGDDPDEVRRSSGIAPVGRSLHPAGRAESRGGRIPMSRGDEPDDPLERARLAAGALEFSEALDLLRTLRGLSFQQVSANAGRHNLPKSTAHLLCRKDTLPKKPEQVRRFVVACGESEQQADEWVAQWRRLVCLERKTKSPATPPGQDVVRRPPVTAAPPVEETLQPAAAEPDRRPPPAPVRWWRRFLAGGLVALAPCALAPVPLDRADVAMTAEDRASIPFHRGSAQNH